MASNLFFQVLLSTQHIFLNLYRIRSEYEMQRRTEDYVYSVYVCLCHTICRSCCWIRVASTSGLCKRRKLLHHWSSCWSSAGLDLQSRSSCTFHPSRPIFLIV